MTYTIGEVAKLTGVPAVTLRAWETRYGIVHPGQIGRASCRERVYVLV